ncbi:Planctomycete cytochrome C [Novipirellula galeiformis]|uniref:Planctomycete cytochrome C n=2 Tax=Novipirellula galeiformis TaxID=2528004 RepID=A0A5C6CCA9_9BACT|nr:Planctomycete cytochrome C [Novipirellula galeiformis]
MPLLRLLGAAYGITIPSVWRGNTKNLALPPRIGYIRNLLAICLPRLSPHLRIMLLVTPSRLLFGNLCRSGAICLSGFAALSTLLLVTTAFGDENTVVMTEQEEHFFEQHVRPVLIERCGECHGAKKQQGGLRVDSLQSLLAGGDSDAAIVPGDAAASLLVSAIRREGGLEMPPNKALVEHEIRSIEAWIDSGARWPAESMLPAEQTPHHSQDHWAFQAVEPTAIPEVQNLADAEWIQTPLDAFIAAKRNEQGLPPSPPADRRTLIRRVTYSLTGLPPTPDEVAAFIHDDDPLAYEKVVERLLQSPHYAEHWGRHWLDVARYSDTKGYVYAREERFWTQAWTYRDWVVKAIRDDLPYDRFLLLQIAADQVTDSQPEDLAAMGLLTLGRRFLGVRRDVIDDRIDVVTRGTMGLTVACARCHDHKYDAIPTADYYSLYGVFDSCYEKQTVLRDHPGDEAFQAELAKRQSTLQETMQQLASESSQRARERIADYLFAQTELHKYPADGFDQIFQKSDLLPAFVRQWEGYLRAVKPNRDSVFALWHAYADLDPVTFATEAENVTRRWHESSVRDQNVNSEIAAAFCTPPLTFRDVCDRYGEVFAQIDPEVMSCDADTEALRAVLNSPMCRVPKSPISHCETFFDSSSVTTLWKLQGDVDRWLIGAAEPIPVAVSLVDLATPVEPRIFLRGNPLKRGDNVPRQFLSVISEPTRQPFQIGSGRLELAQAIIDPQNPLTARVMVNRVWMHHFGTGLVLTPSDFGVRADPPSHPQLLDWLAAEWIRKDWSLKALHRLIVLSATYRQSSTMPENAEHRQRVTRVDPENRLLSRMNPRRVSFEELRDSLLQASGALDRSVGGKPVDMFVAPFPNRRSLYGQIDRQYFPTALRMFDFANPDLHVPQRNQTTVPQQALFFMNHPLVLQRARALANLVRDEPPPQAITQMFQLAYQRAPSEAEMADAMALLTHPISAKATKAESRELEWSYGFGHYDSATQRLEGFTELPHFTGEAWQGGPAWPDDKLGWVQLTATGGHPGNDVQHAAVRRWTAPRAMTVSIRSKVTHQATPGDGIRASIFSSIGGLLTSTSLHKDIADLNVDMLRVQPGETIDFIVDINKVLHSDQYLWEITLEGSPDESWNAESDFPKDTRLQLDELEQLAQVLICTNEFLFVD